MHTICLDIAEGDVGRRKNSAVHHHPSPSPHSLSLSPSANMPAMGPWRASEREGLFAESKEKATHSPFSPSHAPPPPRAAAPLHRSPPFMAKRPAFARALSGLRYPAAMRNKRKSGGMGWGRGIVISESNSTKPLPATAAHLKPNGTMRTSNTKQIVLMRKTEVFQIEAIVIVCDG